MISSWSAFENPPKVTESTLEVDGRKCAVNTAECRFLCTVVCDHNLKSVRMRFSCMIWRFSPFSSGFRVGDIDALQEKPGEPFARKSIGAEFVCRRDISAVGAKCDSRDRLRKGGKVRRISEKSQCLVYVTYCRIVSSWRGRVCSSGGAFFRVIYFVLVRHRSSIEKRKRNNDRCVRVKMSKNLWKRSMTLPSNQLAIVIVLIGCICGVSQGNYRHVYYETPWFPQNC